MTQHTTLFERVLQVAEARTGLTRRAILSRCLRQRHLDARAAIVGFLTAQGWSMPEIARAMGRRSHSSVYKLKRIGSRNDALVRSIWHHCAGERRPPIQVSGDKALDFLERRYLLRVGGER